MSKPRFTPEAIARSHESNRARGLRRFWAYVHVVGECWEWRGSLQTPSATAPGGYGRYNHKFAHRMAYEMVVGPIPPKMEILHRCDNPPCVNPAHLFVGTHADNIADMVAKGRQTHGEKNPQAKLTRAEVDEIRALAPRTSQKALAEQFRVDRSTISLIVNRRLWAS